MASNETMHTFETGAQRSELKPRYDLLRTGPLKRVTDRHEMGLKYGEFNFEAGLPFEDTFNHIIDHLFKYRDRVKQVKRFEGLLEHRREALQQIHNSGADDDLAGAAWGILALMWMEEQGVLTFAPEKVQQPKPEAPSDKETDHVR